MAGFGDFIGKAGGSAEQLFVWGVLQQVIGALTLPYLQALQQAMLETDPNTPLSPDVAATLAARKIIDAGKGAEQAKKSGIDPDLFAAMLAGTMRAPDISAVFELWRRGAIDVGGDDPQQVSVAGALTDQGIFPKWHAPLLKLATSVPTGAEVMNAWLEGQIDRSEAQRRWKQAGGDPTWFQTAYNANGQAPTPVQALELLNRGIIPLHGTGPEAVSYEQAFLEGPWRNKWLNAFVALAEYLPPPRTITAMFHDGQLSHDQAAVLLAKQGLSPELVAAYLAPGATSKTAADKHLAKADVLSLYEDKLIGRPEAVRALQSLGYTAHDATLIIDLADLRVTSAQLRAGIARTRTLFTAGKLTEQGAIDTLVQLGVKRAQARESVTTWALTAAHETKQLSASQIESAWYYNLISAEDAMTLLQRLGYDRFDAWIALSVRNKAPLRDVPRPPSPYGPPPPLKPPTV